MIKNKIKKRIDFWNLSKINSSNISSNYYYSSFFNSEENQKIQKTFIKFDNINSISSSPRSNLSNKYSLKNNKKKKNFY